jgi:hypothetical protein
MSVEHTLQGEVACNVSMDDEEGRRVSPKNLITEVIDASSSTESLIFTKIASGSKIKIEV